MDQALMILGLLLALSFIPAILYALWMRSAGVYRREPLLILTGVFLIGAFVSSVLAYILEELGKETLGSLISGAEWKILLICALAPIIEETTKSLAITSSKKRLGMLENGLIYGAAAGLGFAAGENFLYYNDALGYSTGTLIATFIMRTLSSTLLHASASAIVGYGIARSVITASRGRRRPWWPFLILGMFLHSAFNIMASIDLLLPESDLSVLFSFLGLIGCLALAVVSFRGIRSWISSLSAGFG